MNMGTDEDHEKRKRFVEMYRRSNPDGTMKNKNGQGAKRHRRTQLELSGFSREHLRTIKRISDMSCVPIDQVTRDVVENGIITVMPIYQSMIDFRRTRKAKMGGLFNEQDTDRAGDSEDSGIGSESQPEGEGSADGITVEVTRRTIIGPDYDDEQPGRFPETDPALGGIDADGEIIVE